MEQAASETGVCRPCCSSVQRRFDGQHVAWRCCCSFDGALGLSVAPQAVRDLEADVDPKPAITTHASASHGMVAEKPPVEEPPLEQPP